MTGTEVWYAHLEMSTELLERIARGPGERDLAAAHKVTERPDAGTAGRRSAS